MRTLLLTLVLALAAVSAASAQPSQQPFFNVVTIEASATADVPTDTLTVTLFVEEQGPDPAALATRVNARLEEALARAKKEPKVEAHSGNYQTTPVYDRANQITGWRTRADIVLESRDFKAVSALAGALQPALKLGSMTFSLSRAAREAADAALLTEALAKFQEKGSRRRQGAGLSRLPARADHRAQRRSHPSAADRLPPGRDVGDRPKAPGSGAGGRREERRHRLCVGLGRAGTGEVARRPDIG